MGIYLLLLLSIIIWVGLWYYIWLRNGKEYDVIVEPTSLESAFPPNRRTPALVEYLVSQGKTTKNAFTATILYLVKKKLLQMSTQEYYETGLNEKKYRYIFQFKMKISDNMPEIGLIELNVYNFLLQISVSGEMVTSDEIKEYMAIHQEEVRTFFYVWKRNIARKAQEFQFIEKESQRIRSIFNITNAVFIIYIVQLLEKIHFFIYFNLLEPFEFSLGDMFTLIEAASIALINNILLKKMVSKLHPDFTAAGCFVVGFICLGLVTFFQHSFKVPSFIIPICFIVMFEIILAQTRNRAYQKATASFVTMIMSLTPVFVSILSVIFLKENIEIVQIVGGIFIVSAGFLAEYLEI